MRKIILFWVLVILISGCAQKIIEEQEQPETATPTEQIEEPKIEIFCPDYDGNQEGCLSHEECGWDAGENNCDSIGGVGEEDDNDKEDEEESEYASELEKDLPDTIQNRICKKLPLTKELSPGDRHYCFAIVNKNPEFCEFIKGDNEQDIDAKNEKNLCLAHAKQDVSYCKKISSDLGKRTCYFGLSMISGNINICDGIDWDKDLKQLCHFSFVNALYWEDKSDQITQAHCNKLPEPDRSTCLAYKDRDVSLCKNNVNCLTFFEQPMSFCTGKGSVLESCIRDRAMSSKDFSICETLTGEKREDCIGDFAGHISQDISTCDKLSSISARHSCYKDVAVQSGWLKG
ncbi:MAG: hypothetical protein Q8O03_03660 [Nanoarchaeota archaeon]|nr:hypothetical protein [Nanoarchaeota archaeon]